MTPHRGVLALLFGLAVCMPAVANVRLDADPWLRVDCASFTVYSNAGERRTRELARDLERMSAALGRSILPQPSRGRPTRLFLFRHSASFDSYRDALLGTESDKDGIFFSRPSGSYIIIDGGARGYQRVAFHELTHQLIQGSYGFVPLWVNEGMAGLFETFQLDGTRARAGRIERSDLQMLKTARIPLDQILTMNVRSEDFLSGPRSRLVYAQTRLMMHYVLAGAPSLADRLPMYLDLVRARTEPVEAFERAFGMTLRQFEGELVAYSHRKIHSMLTLEPGFVPISDPTPVPIPPAEIFAELAGLLAEGGTANLPAAESLVRASLGHDPDHERAHVVLGFVHHRRGQLEAALAAYETALELGSTDPLLLGRAGRVALRLSTSAPPGARGARLERAITLFRETVERSPLDAGHWSALGIALARQDQTQGEAREAFETALEIDPGNRTARVWLRRLEAGTSHE
jgi:tetratricopeptide (TPR) repeat protein